jgi:squalene synthase HpnC
VRSTSADRDALREKLREKRRAENFPVALRALPARPRADLVAVYGVARVIDDLGDEAGGDRVALLTAFADDVRATWAGAEPAHPALAALLPAVRAGRLRAEPFLRLVEANLQDQRVTRYDTLAQLLEYCTLSADPVGRIVLAVFGVDDPAAAALSDKVCTALQLLEHWQDVGEDFLAGRIYLPREDRDTFGVTDDDLRAATASPALRALMRFETDRAADLLAEGAPLVRLLRGWARLAVTGFVAGGLATVRALRRSGGDVLGAPVRPSRADTVCWMARLQFGTPTTESGAR